MLARRCDLSNGTAGGSEWYHAPEVIVQNQDEITRLIEGCTSLFGRITIRHNYTDAVVNLTGITELARLDTNYSPDHPSVRVEQILLPDLQKISNLAT